MTQIQGDKLNDGGGVRANAAASGVTALPGEAQAPTGLGPDGRVSAFADSELTEAERKAVGDALRPLLGDLKPRPLADDLLHGAADAAKYLGFKRRTIYNMVEAGTLPHIRKGNLLFFRKSELDAAFVSDEVPQERETKPLLPSRKMPDGHCTLAQMLPLFAELFDPDPARLTALHGRMKNLLRIGALPGRQSCRGRTDFFSPADVRRLLILMDLCDTGITPARAIKLYETQQATIEDPANITRVPVDLNGRTYLNVDMGYMRDVARKHLPQMFYSATGVRRPDRQRIKIDAPVGRHPQGGDLEQGSVSEANSTRSSEAGGAQ